MGREKVLKNIILEAGERALEFFKKDKKLINLRGSSKEIVTQYDKLLDEFIIEKIRKKFPKDQILTEESGYLKGKNEFLWVVDSLDGSANFANQNPLFSISIALFKRKIPIFGAVFAPAIGEFYFAKKGKGAFLNSKRIFVSKIKNLKESYVLWCEGGEKDKNRINKILGKVYPNVKDLRKIGSAGIEICWVTSGRAEIYFTTQIEVWDVAGGILILKEAGGKITDFQGRPWQFKKSDLVFSNKLLHKEFLKLIS